MKKSVLVFFIQKDGSVPLLVVNTPMSTAYVRKYRTKRTKRKKYHKQCFKNRLNRIVCSRFFAH